MRSWLAFAAFIGAALAPVATTEAQMATLGAGVLLSDGPTQPVFEFHAATAPVRQTRAYATFSWTDESASPVIIAAAERRILTFGSGGVGLGAGALLLTEPEFDAVPIAVSSTVIPLRIPRTSIVAIGSTAPFDDFQWSLVLKASVLLWFAR
jgi:hypothetical protein